MSEFSERSTLRVQIYQEIGEERHRQHVKWGIQHWPHFHARSLSTWRRRRNAAIKATDERSQAGYVTWEDILWEEIAEAMAEADWDKRRTELIQVAAVIVAEIEDGDTSNGE